MPIAPPVTNERLPTTRLPNESTKAYAAWRCYAELGTGRTYKETGAKLQKNVTTIAQWASKFQWQERLKTWDDEQAAIHRAAEMQAAVERAVITQKRRVALREKCWMIQEKMTEKFLQMMNFPVATTTVKTSADGHQTTIVMPGPWRFSDAVRMGQMVQQIGGFAVGLTNKMTDPETGETADDEHGIKLPMTPLDLPRMVIEIVDKRAPAPISIPALGESSEKQHGFFTRT